MCGYCFELNGFDLLERHKTRHHDIFDLEWDDLFFLQEADDPLSALQTVTAAAKRQQVIHFHQSSLLVLLCQGMELLLRQGFDSEAYQQLLNNRTFRHAVARVCSKEWQQAFAVRATQPGVTSLALLYEASTYTERVASLQLRLISKRKPAAVALLRYYLREWLLGDRSPKGAAAGAAVSDDRDDAFDALFLALWYSVVLLGPFGASRKLLWQLVVHHREHSDILGFDLWLQRKAALFLFDREGLQPFVQGLGQFRFALIYYLDLKRDLGAERKLLLLNALRQLENNWSPHHHWDNSGDVLRAKGYENWQQWLAAEGPVQP